MYMGGLESSRKVFFFALAILFAWKYINLWPNGLCFEYKGFYAQKQRYCTDSSTMVYTNT